MVPAAKLSVVDRFFEFSILGMLASGFFAVAGSGDLDWPTQVLTILALCARAAAIALPVSFEPSNRAVAALSLAYLGFYPLDFTYVSGSFLTATVHLVFFLAVVKLLTAKSNRDYGYLKIIAVLELLAAAMLSVNITFFGFLALFLLFAVASLASGEVRRSTALRGSAVRGAVASFPRRLSLLSFGLFAGILMMTAVMFFVLPRTARAALRHFVPSRYHLSGFNDEVTLGQIGEIKQGSRTVMHVRSYREDSLDNLRWRGAALSEFDGRRWFNPDMGDDWIRVERGMLVLPHPAPTRPGRNLTYRVQLEEIAGDTLFFAGLPETLTISSPVLRRSRSGLLRVPAIGPNGLGYGVFSFLEQESGSVVTAPVPLPLAAREELLRLPELDARIPALARQMTEAASGDQAKAEALEKRLRTGYGYTLQLLSSPVDDPLAHFLFVRKKGHCEYFASAMAVMLRTQGIPSRVVTGFLAGSFNPITGWQVIRESDAHSWVEAWIAGRGWTTFDPTPSAAGFGPSRISQAVSLYLDAAGQFWQDWVLSYDLQRQLVLASRIEDSGRRARRSWFPDPAVWNAVWKDRAARFLKSWSIVWTAVAALAALLWFFRDRLLRWWRANRGVRRAQRGQGQASDASLLYARMLRILERRGFQKPPWLTPSEFVRVLPATPLSSLVGEATAAYNEFRFGGRPQAAPRMVQLLDQLEKL